MSWRIPRKVCPIGVCTEPVRVDRIMCRAHWRNVPRDLKVHNKRSWLHAKATGDGAMNEDSVAECVIAAQLAEEN